MCCFLTHLILKLEGPPKNIFEMAVRLRQVHFQINIILAHSAMQQNIRKTLAKANKDKGQIQKDEKKSNSKRSKPSLLRMLSSNIVAENTKENTKRSKEADISSIVSPLTRTYPTNVEIAPEASVPRSLVVDNYQQNQQHSTPSTTASLPVTTKPCPLCGGLIHVDLFDQHMQEEIILLAIDDDDDDLTGWVEHILSPLEQQQEQQRPIRTIPPQLPVPVPPQGPKVYILGGTPSMAVEKLPPTLPPQQPKVYILGGTPSMAVPRNPKKLKPLPPEYKRQIKPVKAYNYYADGGGNMDGDEIGLDGFENVGVGWEGVGATTF